jgi:hypothetical protein
LEKDFFLWSDIGRGVKAQSTEHRAQSTEHRAQSTEHRAQNTEHRAQGTGHRAQGTGHKTTAMNCFFSERLSGLFEIMLKFIILQEISTL